jgi:hypothetical protein
LPRRAFLRLGPRLYQTSTCLGLRAREPTVAQRWLFLRKVCRASHALQEPQFCRPICQRQAQTLHIGMAVPKQPFDFRYLPAATFDSRRLLPALCRDLLEGPAIRLELGLVAA